LFPNLLATPFIDTNNSPDISILPSYTYNGKLAHKLSCVPK
jgi:hypothetical protein